ncbi:N-acyl-L-homoserine lactone synthetase [Palleronia marisminoris]|uniref:Acyl-homoserine-lactone synthase n=1 Tax=Palleronia marisminoris TaxID=315423 RepID=A0A1Y5TGG3_9RHOB|nr:acyl-homoserine-lactone synthase [Palleronia marisminoris]SFH32121.1 N-acyl-L-homoserine lactone synthetase [Palleronia marisminoris]SLN61348.1 Acyl-homoserine-lactone synthase [Palleronia marisminoris]
MIIIVDALNRHEYSGLLDRMFQLRAQVFGGRLGWDVHVENGREVDQFDALDPGYVIGVNEDGEVVSCVRALQTTGPHMLADVFSAILGGEAPLRSPTVWESTRFCVDTKRLGLGRGPGTISGATSELMIGSLEWAMTSGISDIVTVIDPIMNKVLKRSNNAPYDYLGETTQMGKVPAMAALLDCTPERIARVREFSGIDHDVFANESQARRFSDAAPVAKAEKATDAQMQSYLEEQLAEADTARDRAAALRTWNELYARGLVASRPPIPALSSVS